MDDGVKFEGSILDSISVPGNGFGENTVPAGIVDDDVIDSEVLHRDRLEEPRGILLPVRVCKNRRGFIAVCPVMAGGCHGFYLVVELGNKTLDMGCGLLLLNNSERLEDDCLGDETQNNQENDQCGYQNQSGAGSYLHAGNSGILFLRNSISYLSP